MANKVKVITKKVKKKGAPAYMVSFGDMMTLILCFFILLVSMSKERNYGLMAKGIGSFIVAIKTHGLNGIMDAQERLAIFDEVRRRFNLPPEEDPERRASHLEATPFELLRTKALESLKPHQAIRQPHVARFAVDSAILQPGSRDYLDSLADSLRPGSSQVLLLEGHSNDAGERFAENDRWLAFERAATVRRYMIEEHGFPPDRVEARAWLEEIVLDEATTRSVDARLVLPARKRTKR